MGSPKLLISTDEAGYGPNLGPLTLGATAWVVHHDADLYDQLDSVVTRDADTTGDRIHIADSKRVYRSGNLANLELPVLAVLCSLTGSIPTSMELMLQQLSLDECGRNRFNSFWFKPDAIAIPFSANPAEIQHLAERFRQTCQKSKVKVTHLACTPIFPTEFNQQCQREGNKSNLLSAASLRLVRKLLDANTVTPAILVQCDKHGGRNRYGALIQHHLVNDWVTPVEESTARSTYRGKSGSQEIMFQFSARGESQLTIALSSMIAKYVRELAMIAWNRFWQQHLPNLKPTQGYPLDAGRFLKDIAVKQSELGVEMDSIWRSR